MNIPRLFALLPLACLPFLVFATPEIDSKIETTARDSYTFRTLLERRVTVSAVDGVATLRGTVEDKEESKLAADTAANLTGVTSVVNELEIAPTTDERSDTWIAAKVRNRLLVRSKVSGTATKVQVKEGVVTLTGTATTQAQKKLTATYAQEVAGVKTVVNKLKVGSAPAMSLLQNDVVDDASVTTQVNYALLNHPRSRGLKIQVSASGGVVTVTGTASTKAEKALVEKLAMDVRGVRSVTNQITVNS